MRVGVRAGPFYVSGRVGDRRRGGGNGQSSAKDIDGNTRFIAFLLLNVLLTWWWTKVHSNTVLAIAAFIWLILILKAFPTVLRALRKRGRRVVVGRVIDYTAEQ